jgi:hypothetical protein
MELGTVKVFTASFCLFEFLEALGTSSSRSARHQESGGRSNPAHIISNHLIKRAMREKKSILTLFLVDTALVALDIMLHVPGD